MTGRTRLSLFSQLEALGAQWHRVLDLYAGTGALGLEALSRGAQWVDFVDMDPRACRAIRANLARLGFQERAHVHLMPADRAVDRLPGGYTLVFFDPPFDDPGAGEVFQKLAKSSLLAEGAFVVWQHRAGREVPESIGALSLVRARRLGDSGLAIYRNGGRP